MRVISLNERRFTDPEAVIAGLPPKRGYRPSVAVHHELLTRRSYWTAYPPVPHVETT